ncbi:MAG: diguanylate cyclase [Thermoleophilaceae bacterium]|nr:diguanylate cyclase [Thermoleophilaceae bacterium]
MRPWPARAHLRVIPRLENVETLSALTDARVASTFLGAAYCFGSLAGLVVLAVAAPPGADRPGLAAVNGAALACGLLLIALRGRVTRTGLSAAFVAGAALVGLGLVASENRAGVYELFFVWIALEAAFFLRGRETVVPLAAIAISAGVAFAVESPPGAGALWAATVGTAVLAGLVVGWFKGCVQNLIDRLADAARKDPLTELWNRRGFQDVLEAELSRARRTDRPLSLLVVDLDHFKLVNDRLGHPGGDAVLKSFGAQMRRLTRGVDVPARLGGEEFAVLLPEAEKHDAFLVAERLRRAAKAAFADGPAPLTVSVGVACHPDDGDGADDLLRAGDQALYAAKQLGRDRSVIYNADVVAGIGQEAARQDVSQLSSLLLLAETIDVRYSGTAKHSQAVGRYARAIAAELELPQPAVERLALAGVLHDVGKIGVSDAVLQKPGPLDDAETDEARSHPELGARILAGANLGDLAEWVFAHHERVDGSGYPLGLNGEQIPLEARILAVADAFEAMTSERPYSPALPRDEAAAELRRCAGTQFDPEVVEALLRAVRSERAAATLA